MGKKTGSERTTRPVVPEPFNSLLPGPRYVTEDRDARGKKVKGHGNSRSESQRAADKKVRRGSGGCFLTTACVQAAGLGDACAELSTLRNFRDRYLAALPEGPEMIATYYAKAPAIVAAIARSGHAHSVYREILVEIRKAVRSIECGNNEQALSIYVELFNRLSREYLIAN